MKVEVNPKYSFLETFIEVLPNLFEKEGELLYKARNVLKLFEVDGYVLNVKKYKKPIIFNRFAYTFLRKSKACRAFENALHLLNLGFDTPEPVAFIELKTGGLLRESYFISLQCPYKRLFREFADNKPLEGRESVPEVFGQYAARLHQAGILHKDLSIGNILFEIDNDGVRFSLVDLNRMRFGSISPKMGLKNFERLRGNFHFFELLAKGYTTLQPIDPKKCLDLMLHFQKINERHFQRKSKRKRFFRKLLDKPFQPNGSTKQRVA
jgi:serine/threonine protein kinase